MRHTDTDPMAPGTSDQQPLPPKKPEPQPTKSYLASAVDSINPWATSTASRSTTPTPASDQPVVPPTISNPGDHSTNPFYGQSQRRYPPDCPPANVLWFHAADVPKRKPKFLQDNKLPEDGKKTPPQPKKYVPFSTSDSRSLEAAYQKKLAEFEEEKKARKEGKKRARVVSGEERKENDGKTGTKVPVNEDFLFDVDIEGRELGPVYWEGPTYDVRRGSWFYQEGSSLRPCEENLAAQLEEGYLKIRPWLYKARMTGGGEKAGVAEGSSAGDLKGAAATQVKVKEGGEVVAHQPQTYRLFGTYMNSVATYQDANTAWLSSDGMLSWVTSTVYERFAGGGYMSGVKLVRGYTEQKKAKEAEEKRPSTPTGTKSLAAEQDENLQKALKRRSAPASVRSGSIEIDVNEEEGEAEVKFESTQARITRQLSNLIDSGDRDAESEAIRKREEKEIQDDYNARQGETQGRDIEHLVLVTHGIGQLLGRRMESVNFVHDVNVMRKTLKTVYSASEDLRALNSENGEGGPGNCRVQVLPVVWRHLLDFPKRRQKKGEHDLGQQFTAEEDEYPSLEDITVEGMAFARSLISDLALDVLLYQSAYREQIADIVSKESNRIYKLFMERNPDFKGKVHIVGHSLGSAIMFDILCRQREKQSPQVEQPRNPLRFWPTQDRYEPQHPKDLAFDFNVDDFYCLGSPVGLFQMLKGRTIAARHLSNSLASESPFNPDYMEDPFLNIPPHNPYTNDGQRVSPITGLPFSISSPKTSQLFNIFHPSDPIAYRLEPLISPVMATLKPQVLPYTKKSIFGSVAPQGLTGIGAKVGQSVSGLWSSFSAGIASSLLNQSLGLKKEDVARFQQQQQQQQHHAHSPGAGTNIVGGGVLPPPEANLSDVKRSEKTAERMKQLAASGSANGTVSGNEATLIDDELETLFSRFQKKRLDIAKSEAVEGEEGKKVVTNALSEEDLHEEEVKAAKLRGEELKVRALNRNGRVDYCIQESVLDFNPINTIASHMSYWADEDVGHFVLSQMLSAQKNKGLRTPTPLAGKR